MERISEAEMKSGVYGKDGEDLEAALKMMHVKYRHNGATILITESHEKAKQGNEEAKQGMGWVSRHQVFVVKDREPNEPSTSTRQLLRFDITNDVDSYDGTYRVKAMMKGSGKEEWIDAGEMTLSRAEQDKKGVSDSLDTAALIFQQYQDKTGLGIGDAFKMFVPECFFGIQQQLIAIMRQEENEKIKSTEMLKQKEYQDYLNSFMGNKFMGRK